MNDRDVNTFVCVLLDPDCVTSPFNISSMKCLNSSIPMVIINK